MWVYYKPTYSVHNSQKGHQGLLGRCIASYVILHNFYVIFQNYNQYYFFHLGPSGYKFNPGLSLASDTLYTVSSINDITLFMALVYSTNIVKDVGTAYLPFGYRYPTTGEVGQHLSHHMKQYGSRREKTRLGGSRQSETLKPVSSATDFCEFVTFPMVSWVRCGT